ncbi:MAG: 16S rRNA (guanine(527)-N(7))-methyltransferase RsmG [Idiomarina sp.]|nr:16S rRNA (guanine(527)-N(7))-methyltransferase RsmG [Idiomarina sp.]
MKHAAPDAAVLRQQLVKLLTQTDLAVTDQQIDQLITLVLLLNKWNKAYNLTSVRDPQQMLVRHILDSVMVSPFLQGEMIADVGTGPGLPGLPLAIINPQRHFVLIDSLGKRINFIRQIVHQLGLKNVTAIQSRVEDYQPEQPFSCVLSRAFASLADMLRWCHHLPAPDGQFLALKGQLDQSELEAIPAEYAVLATDRLQVPQLDALRHVVTIGVR